MDLRVETMNEALELISESREWGDNGNKCNMSGEVDWDSSRIHDWAVTGSWWIPLGLTSGYLLFVLLVGPNAMSGRPPFRLKSFALAYNALMVAYSSALLYGVIYGGKSRMLSLLGSACRAPYPVDQNTIDHFDSMGWYYMLSKYIEFIDTVIFVLRHKQNQVTFLHVYHHTNMALSTWYVVKYLRERHVIMILMVNSFVHVCMYSYYMLSALGPKFRKYLWWKPYITRLQIGQFLVIIGYQLGLVLFGCDINPSSMTFFTCNTVSFLVLFADFYRKAYRPPQKSH